MKLVFNRSYTPGGFSDRVFHLHVRCLGDPDELYFRDNLVEHSEAREAYADVKRDLARRYERDRDACTEGKATSVRETTARARELYGSRYSLDMIVQCSARLVTATPSGSGVAIAFLQWAVVVATQAQRAEAPTSYVLAGIALCSVASSWAMIQVGYLLRYASEYYRSADGNTLARGIDFNQPEDPEYTDFGTKQLKSSVVKKA